MKHGAGSARAPASSSAGRVPWPMVCTRTRIQSPLRGKRTRRSRRGRQREAMAATVSWDGLRELAAFRAEKGCAISVYLDLDPSVAPTPADAASRINSLTNEGEERIASTHELTHEQREALRRDFARIRNYFENEFDREGTRGLALFCAGLDNFWHPLPLADSIHDRINVGREFYLAPLVPLVGRGDGALIAFVGRERGDVYRLQAGPPAGI